jgi:hypothetical protein
MYRTLNHADLCYLLELIAELRARIVALETAAGLNT